MADNRAGLDSGHTNRRPFGQYPWRTQQGHEQRGDAQARISRGLGLQRQGAGSARVQGS